MFSDATAFLSDLADHNNKEWFESNRKRYEAAVKAPAQRFVTLMAPRLARMSPELLAIPSGAGSSVSRINRDTRFSADKSPYKDYLGIHFAHRSGKDAPGLHLHVSASDAGVGVGVWALEPPALLRVRDRIVDPQGGWAAVRRDLDIGSCRFIGDNLKRVPKGYPEDHPFADDLKRKTFGATLPVDLSLPEAALLDSVEGSFRRSWPLMQFLCDALGLPL
jgi:uncharacterized protein (TIGR02453 family)